MRDRGGLLHAGVEGKGGRDVLVTEQATHHLMTAWIVLEVYEADQVTKLVGSHAHAEGAKGRCRNLL